MSGALEGGGVGFGAERVETVRVTSRVRGKRRHDLNDDNRTVQRDRMKEPLLLAGGSGGRPLALLCLFPSIHQCAHNVNTAATPSPHCDFGPF